jgi:hypothetical protein
MDFPFPQKVFNGASELPLLRNTQTRHKRDCQSDYKKREGAYLHLPTSWEIEPDLVTKRPKTRQKNELKKYKTKVSIFF